MPVSDPDISRSRLIRNASFLEADRLEIALRRGRHNANREIGLALKTEFVLQYMSEPQLRAQVRRGLLQVEQLHAMARGAVYYRQRGRINAREVYDQVNACSCPTLILACIVYWQAREIARIGAAPGFPFDPDLLRHVSPIEWKKGSPHETEKNRTLRRTAGTGGVRMKHTLAWRQGRRAEASE